MEHDRAATFMRLRAQLPATDRRDPDPGADVPATDPGSRWSARNINTLVPLDYAYVRPVLGPRDADTQVESEELNARPELRRLALIDRPWAPWLRWPWSRRQVDTHRIAEPLPIFTAARGDPPAPTRRYFRNVPRPDPHSYSELTGGLEED